MKPKIRFCKIEKFNDIIEERIKDIDKEIFLSLLQNTHQNKFLYKKIYAPNFSYGYFERKYKPRIDDYFNLTNENNYEDFPNKNYSLVCSTIEENEIGTTFLVFPFKESLFTIKESDNYFKGYWRDKIKWLDKLKNNEIWTEDSCILIKKSIWINFKKDYKI